MAKALGLIGNFKGKLGNTVGYSLKDSNNKQTQGVRVYQPVVRNPKTAAQAEQRAKLAPINATYRALKIVIDRGQEGKAYGNKSRLAWLSDAMKAFNGPWIKKGAVIDMPALVPITKGSLPISFSIDSGEVQLKIDCTDITAAGTNKVGLLSTALIAAYPALQNGDQITFVVIKTDSNGILASVDSIVLDTTSTENLPSFITCGDNVLKYRTEDVNTTAYAAIVSREGDNGAHLRSKTSLILGGAYDQDKLADDAKQAAIESYMSQGANTDWAEESLK